jgi:non-ribosomal peptide synthetase component F
MTYAELNSRANQLARYLGQFDIKPEVPVGLCAERSLGMVVGMLGILKAGGAYVPLDPKLSKGPAGVSCWRIPRRQWC